MNKASSVCYDSLQNYKLFKVVFVLFVYLLPL